MARGPPWREGRPSDPEVLDLSGDRAEFDRRAERHAGAAAPVEDGPLMPEARRDLRFEKALSDERGDDRGRFRAGDMRAQHGATCSPRCLPVCAVCGVGCRAGRTATAGLIAAPRAVGMLMHAGRGVAAADNTRAHHSFRPCPVGRGPGRSRRPINRRAGRSPTRPTRQRAQRRMGGILSGVARGTRNGERLSVERRPGEVF